MSKTAGTIETEPLRLYVRQLKKEGMRAECDYKVGCVAVYDGPVKVLSAVQHPAGYWIARFLDSERVKWGW